MLVAKDAAGELVDIDMALPDGVYFCPKCGGELIQRRGLNVPMHFAHRVDSNCDGSGNMTDWHANWQKDFPESCREITMFSGGAQHRADVVLGSVVLEFQHSRISNDDWYARSSFYGPDFEKRVFWVYDRVGLNVPRDLNLMVFSGYFGCDSLAKREFFRNVLEFGPDLPVFLDYGRFLAMCYDFDCIDGLCRARSCLLLTRTGFVDLMHVLGRYPWLIMQEFDMESYVTGRLSWFCAELDQVLSDFSGLSDFENIFRRQVS